mmetsp:Transcript_12947/g.25034  ORF Transcript_12947/g.25034 Transcript_12947/m.25034 type:complete len:272 (+) Transcript_12947:740-1555(+)
MALVGRRTRPVIPEKELRRARKIGGATSIDNTYIRDKVSCFAVDHFPVRSQPHVNPVKGSHRRQVFSCSQRRQAATQTCRARRRCWRGGRVGSASEPNGCSSVVALAHQREAVVLRQLECALEVPLSGFKSCWLVVRASFHQHHTRVVVAELVSKLPHIAHQVANSERTAASRCMRVYVFRAGTGVSNLCFGSMPTVVSPRVDAGAVFTLCGVLPLPSVGQPFSLPVAVGTSLSQRQIRNRLFFETLGRLASAIPVVQPPCSVSRCIPSSR